MKWNFGNNNGRRAPNTTVPIRTRDRADFIQNLPLCVTRTSPWIAQLIAGRQQSCPVRSYRSSFVPVSIRSPATPDNLFRTILPSSGIRDAAYPRPRIQALRRPPVAAKCRYPDSFSLLKVDGLTLRLPKNASDHSRSRDQWRSPCRCARTRREAIGADVLVDVIRGSALTRTNHRGRESALTGAR
jgi:hypothetical protein